MEMGQRPVNCALCGVRGALHRVWGTADLLHLLQCANPTVSNSLSQETLLVAFVYSQQ